MTRPAYIRLHDTGDPLPRVLAADRANPVDADGQPIGTVYRVKREIAKTRTEAAACVAAFKSLSPEELELTLRLPPRRLTEETRLALAVEIEAPEEASHA
jgi:hypothetical protein